MIPWLLAFFLHSTFWFTLAWLATRLAPQVHPRTRETIWYTAIMASLISSTVHAVAPDSVASLWRLALPGVLFAPEAAQIPGAAVSGSSLDAAYVDWEMILFRAWVSISTLLLVQYIAQLVTLRRTLAREPLDADSPEVAVLRDISHTARLPRSPRLTESDDLGSPIAIGFGRRAEICVPTRALHELDQDQFRAMLSHEVAHHVRHDPVRMGAINLLRAVFFFQPLFRVARRDVHWAAEEQCDEWASGHVDDRLAMASCLAEVASWVLPGDRRLPVVGLMQKRSQLVRRVDRLMDERSSFGSRGRFWRGFGSTSRIVLSPWLVPGLAPAGEGSSEIPAATQPTDATTTLPVPAVRFFPPAVESRSTGVSSDGEEHDEGSRDERADHDGREAAEEHGRDHGEEHGAERGDGSDHENRSRP